MTEQLIVTLGQIQSLRTTTLRSTLPFKQTTRPRAEIAKLLGVDAVLEGTIVGGSPDAGNVRLDAQLIAAGSGETIWSGVIPDDRAAKSQFCWRIPPRRSPARWALRSRAPKATRLGQVRSTSPAAEEAYLQGRMHLANYGPEPARRALGAFERAVEIDPGYAAAHAGRRWRTCGLAGPAC